MAHLVVLTLRVAPQTKKLLEVMAKARGNQRLMGLGRELLELGLRERLAELGAASRRASHRAARRTTKGGRS